MDKPVITEQSKTNQYNTPVHENIELAGVIENKSDCQGLIKYFVR
ncbi:hypothetical protein ACX3NB_002438 [Staphylococcus pseudintermedius]|nr:hypothetical protein [Staphylococcus pseudintermedius]MDK4022532.1 hypothetical protein [Staphylococcus pseudintermedius]MDK4027299.1 hypothetical protein [Staphylococcus pseudintermedius]